MRFAAAFTACLLLATAPAFALFGWGKKEQLTCAVFNEPVGSGAQAVVNAKQPLANGGATVTAKVDVPNNGRPYLKGVTVVLQAVTDAAKKRWLTGRYTDATGKVLYSQKTALRDGSWSAIAWDPQNLVSLRSQCLIEKAK